MLGISAIRTSSVRAICMDGCLQYLIPFFWSKHSLFQFWLSVCIFVQILVSLVDDFWNHRKIWYTYMVWLL